MPPMERPFLIGIAGGSGSGKTTFARRLVDACARSGIAGRIFSLDNYYQPLGHMTLARRRSYNFDHPDAIDFALAAEHLKALLAGRPVRQPVYDFKLHTRKEATSLRRPSPLIVVEGLYALYPPEILVALGGPG